MWCTNAYFCMYIYDEVWCILRFDGLRVVKMTTPYTTTNSLKKCLLPETSQQQIQSYKRSTLLFGVLVIQYVLVSQSKMSNFCICKVCLCCLHKQIQAACFCWLSCFTIRPLLYFYCCFHMLLFSVLSDGLIPSTLDTVSSPWIHSA